MYQRALEELDDWTYAAASIGHSGSRNRATGLHIIHVSTDDLQQKGLLSHQLQNNNNNNHHSKKTSASSFSDDGGNGLGNGKKANNIRHILTSEGRIGTNAATSDNAPVFFAQQPW